ncbi:hypothetical protein [Lysobacter hankyongensis]|uniref:Lipoprotein n=1 Tax=Lysobacter hankyongensis TaxID=1176535 RepID=A0ABP9AU43_9GAMM
MTVARIRAFLLCAAVLAACPADAAPPVAAPRQMRHAPVSGAVRPPCPAPAAKPSPRAETVKAPAAAHPATRQPVADRSPYGDAHYAASDLQREIARRIAQQDCMDPDEGDRFGSHDAWGRIDARGTADDDAGAKDGDKSAGTP